MGYYSKAADPIGKFDWSLIGLKFAPEILLSYRWRFEILDKKKLLFNMIKYGFLI